MIMYSPSKRKRTKTTCALWVGREDFPEKKPYGFVEEGKYFGIERRSTPISRFRR